MSGPRILFLSHHWPLPPDSGGRLRTYHTLQALSTRFRVSLLSFVGRSGDESGEEAANFGCDLERIRRVPRRDTAILPGGFVSHVRSLLSGRPYTEFAFDSGAMRREIEAVSSELGFELVHADTYHLYPVFDALPDCPLSCTFHDIHSEILQRQARVDPNPFRRAYLSMQAGRLEQMESRCSRRADVSVVVSERDRDRLAEMAPDSHAEVVPNGVRLEDFDGWENSDGEGVVFVGASSWYPNLDAIRYFARDVLPLVRRRRESVRATWVGSLDPAHRKELGSVPGLELTGHVSDVRPYVEKAGCVVVPLRAGSGTRLKILEAWAMQKAVVSTSIGCEGLRAFDGENILIRDDPSEFADAIDQVLSEPGLRAELGASGRRTVEELYDWKQIGARLNSAYARLIGREG